jgi:hypothetical protein
MYTGLPFFEERECLAIWELIDPFVESSEGQSGHLNLLSLPLVIVILTSAPTIKDDYTNASKISHLQQT